MPKKVDNTSDGVTEITIRFSLPQWCQNLSDNMQSIKENDKLSTLICKTYPHCWKLSKLKEYALGNDEYELQHVIDTCRLHPKQIEHVVNNTLYDYNFACTGICEECKEYIQIKKPCLIVGGGPSLKRYNHLSLLKKYGFNGDIVVVDSTAKELLENGIIPKYISVADSTDYVKTYFDHDIIHKHSDKMTGLFSTIIHPSVNTLFKGKKVFYNAYIDERYSTLFFLMTNAPLINPCGNIGSTSIMIAATLGYNPIILIGMDLSFESFEDMKVYYSNNKSYFNPNNIQRDWTNIKIKSDMNPIYNKEYYMDDVFEAYKISTLYNIKDIVTRDISIINCSEQGALHSEDIKNIKFEEYLKSQGKI